MKNDHRVGQRDRNDASERVVSRPAATGASPEGGEQPRLRRHGDTRAIGQDHAVAPPRRPPRGEPVGLLRHRLEKPMPQVHRQPSAGLGPRASRGHRTRQPRTGRHGVRPNQFRTGLERFLRPDRREEHVQHGDDGRQRPLAVPVPDGLAEPVNQTIR